MKMKALVIFLGLILTVPLFTSCGGESINVYNWGDYIDEELLVQFKEETGISVNYETFASNEDMYAKLQGGGSNYDIVIPSDYMIEKMIKNDMLEKINFNAIPNYKNIGERFKQLDYDPSNEYSVPYMWGTVGILYNKQMLDKPVTSWDALWDERYKGQIFMYASQRDSIGAALKKLGYSLNSTNSDELEEAKRLLIEQKKLVEAYVDDSVKHKMIGEEGALAVVYSGDATFCKEENENLEYVVPEEGSNVWFDAIVIPKGAKNKANAERFIDFLCRGDVAYKNTEYIGYSTVNEEAFNLLPSEKQESPVYWPDDEIYYRCETFKDLGDYIKEYDRVWTEVLAYSE